MTKEHFIIFEGESIRAIYADLKTQTRRVATEFCDEVGEWADAVYPAREFGFVGWWGGQMKYEDLAEFTKDAYKRGIVSRYGLSGDRLWVKEIYATPGNYDAYKPSELRFHCTSSDLVYRATEQYGDVYYTWRSPMFMPYWAHRLDLDVITIKPERLQDISQADAKAEGAACPLGVPEDVEIGYVLGFKRRWDALNAKRGYPWSSNPWVWAIEFKRVKT